MNGCLGDKDWGVGGGVSKPEGIMTSMGERKGEACWRTRKSYRKWRGREQVPGAGNPRKSLKEETEEGAGGPRKEAGESLAGSRAGGKGGGT